jgi:hypothetical protein
MCNQVGILFLPENLSKDLHFFHYRHLVTYIADIVSPTSVLSLTLSLFHSCRSTCFLRNGTVSDSPAAQPCSSDRNNPLAAICCKTGWENPAGGDVRLCHTNNECLPSSLCQNRGKISKEGEE